MELKHESFKSIENQGYERRPYIYIRKYDRYSKLIFNSLFIQETQIKGKYDYVQLSINETDLILGFTFCNIKVKGIKTKHKLTVSRNEMSISAAFLLNNYSFILPGMYIAYVVNKDFKSDIFEVKTKTDLNKIKPDDRFFFIKLAGDK